jgi:hypothetical protein
LNEDALKEGMQDLETQYMLLFAFFFALQGHCVHSICYDTDEAREGKGGKTGKHKQQ